MIYIDLVRHIACEKQHRHQRMPCTGKCRVPLVSAATPTKSWYSVSYCRCSTFAGCSSTGHAHALQNCSMFSMLVRLVLYRVTVNAWMARLILSVVCASLCRADIGRPCGHRAWDTGGIPSCDQSSRGCAHSSRKACREGPECL